MKVIQKIVITGGPCAGKSTAMSWIRNAFTQRGYTVLIITCGSNEEYQVCQVDLQLTKERLFVQAAESMAAEKILIVCDRGILDNKAYMTEAEFLAVQRALCGAEVGRVEG